MKKIVKIFNNIEALIAVVLFITLILLGTTQVVSRFIFNYSIAWSEELSRYVFIGLVYISASLAILRDRHIRVEAVDLLIPIQWQKHIRSFADTVWLLFSLIVAYKGIDVATRALEINQTTPALQFQLGIILMIIPITFFLMSLRILQLIIRRYKQQEEIL